MKKFICRLIVLAIVGLFLATVAAQAAEFRKAVQISGGAGSLTLEPTYNSVATGVKVEAIIFTTGAPATNGAAFVVGTITNTLGTKAITATDRTLIITSAPSLFMGDKVLITSSSAATQIVYIVGSEF